MCRVAIIILGNGLKNAPFFLNYGMHPFTPVSVRLPRTVPQARDFQELITEAV